MSLNEERESLAAERTSLAWGRTSLALLACGAAVIKGVPTVTERAGRPLAGAIIVVLAATLWVHGLWNERRRRIAITRGDRTAEASWLRGTATTTVLVGLLAFMVTLVG
jgi:uncharacterized membrane protein YidH (DUF202 family)